MKNIIQKIILRSALTFREDIEISRIENGYIILGKYFETIDEGADYIVSTIKSHFGQ